MGRRNGSVHSGLDARQLPIPHEGEGGVFSQSWFPVCLSEDVSNGSVQGFDFLDGQIVIFRNAEGAAKAMSAYCPHLGANLCVGDVVDDTVRCPFHHWRYDHSGKCVATGGGDPVPSRAKLFAFPTTERFGLIWVFNGEEPLFDLPSFSVPDEDLVIRVEKFELPLMVDPWVICCNTPDMQHIEVVHGISFDGGMPHDKVEWTSHSMMYEFTGRHRQGEPIGFRVGIFGTSIFFQEGEMNGNWFGFLAPFALPKPGETHAFLVSAVRADLGSDAEIDSALSAATELEKRVTFEDVPILETARFRPGTLTKSDRSLARFLEYLRKYPRAHPSGEFIR